jgi:hypothetical protein
MSGGTPVGTGSSQVGGDAKSFSVSGDRLANDQIDSAPRDIDRRQASYPRTAKCLGVLKARKDDAFDREQVNVAR